MWRLAAVYVLLWCVVLWWVLLGCVLLWCDVVLCCAVLCCVVWATQFDEEPFAEAFGKTRKTTTPTIHKPIPKLLNPSAGNDLYIE